MTALYKAQPTGGCDVPDVEITIAEPIPAFVTLEQSPVLYRAQAKMLNTLLRTSLPGGTYHALLVEMLESKASLLRVPEPTT